MYQVDATKQIEIKEYRSNHDRWNPRDASDALLADEQNDFTEVTSEILLLISLITRSVRTSRLAVKSLSFEGTFLRVSNWRPASGSSKLLRHLNLEIC